MCHSFSKLRVKCVSNVVFSNRDYQQAHASKWWGLVWCGDKCETKSINCNGFSAECSDFKKDQTFSNQDKYNLWVVDVDKVCHWKFLSHHYVRYFKCSVMKILMDVKLYRNIFNKWHTIHKFREQTSTPEITLIDVLITNVRTKQFVCFSQFHPNDDENMFSFWKISWK